MHHTARRELLYPMHTQRHFLLVRPSTQARAAQETRIKQRDNEREAGFAQTEAMVRLRQPNDGRRASRCTVHGRFRRNDARRGCGLGSDECFLEQS